MLLFYIILWIPCTYINKQIHQMRNVNQLLLLNHAKDEEPITEDKLSAANVSYWYFLSNPVIDYFSSSAKNANNLVKAG